MFLLYNQVAAEIHQRLMEEEKENQPAETKEKLPQAAANKKVKKEPPPPPPPPKKKKEDKKGKWGKDLFLVLKIARVCILGLQNKLYNFGQITFLILSPQL